MKPEDRRAAIAAYKERKAVAGIYAVRCTATGEVWVGQTPDVDAVQNRIWFSARMGTNPCASLQRAWTTHGAATISFEVVERLKPEDLAYLRNALLKERVTHWRAVLDAQAI
jgi:hypothetical protein